MKLRLGVVDVAHPGSPGTSTGDVAEILEKKYHIMEAFFQQHETEIVALLEASMADAFEDALRGGAGVADMTAAESGIETLFRFWLSRGGLDGLAPGVPTAAALRGVSHRRKHPYARRGPRPSFIDTGTYVAAFKAWVSGGLGVPRGNGGASMPAAAEGEEEAVVAEDVGSFL